MKHHSCIKCGAYATFARAVDPIRGREGEWYCATHWLLTGDGQTQAADIIGGIQDDIQDE